MAFLFGNELLLLYPDIITVRIQLQMHLGVLIKPDRSQVGQKNRGGRYQCCIFTEARNSTQLECVLASVLAPRQTHDCQSVGYFWQGLRSRVRPISG